MHVNKKWLFPCPPNNDYVNLQIDNDSVHFITPPTTSSAIVSVLKLHLDTNKLVILDCTAGCGGDTITFAQNFKHVFACELDRNRHAMLENNLAVYNLKNVTCLNVDAIKFIVSVENVDVVYIDPPWGGKDYKHFERLRLKFSDIDLHVLIQQIFNKQICSSDIKLIAIKLPRNYDFDTLNCLPNVKVNINNIGKIVLVTIHPVQTAS